MSAMEEQKSGKRLVIFPFPFTGHLNATLEVANILYAKGFSITIIHTHLNSPDPNKHPQFTFHFISDGLSESEQQQQQYSKGDPIVFINKLNTTCVYPFQSCLSKLVSDSSSEPIACLITDNLWYFSKAVADGLNLRTIFLWTTNVSCFLAFGLSLLPIQDDQPEKLVEELPPLRVKDIPRFKGSDQQQVFILISSFLREMKASSGIIINSFKGLEDSMLDIYCQNYPKLPLFLIGPFHKRVTSSPNNVQDDESISWLNTQAPKSVIYVSFGTIATISEAQFLELAWGLANSNQPFLWVLRPSSVIGTFALREGFMEKVAGRARFVEWAPQKEVLAHPAIGGFLTHCGWNSTLESICEGVPMICFPCFGDQLVNARVVTDLWKVGWRLDGDLNRGEIEKSVRRLLVGNESEELRKRIECIKNQTSASLISGKVPKNDLENLIDLIRSF